MALSGFTVTKWRGRCFAVADNVADLILDQWISAGAAFSSQATEGKYFFVYRQCADVSDFHSQRKFLRRKPVTVRAKRDNHDVFFSTIKGFADFISIFYV